MQQAVSEPDPLQKTLFTEKLDNLLLHRRWGYLILLSVLFLLFQSVFWLAQYPMDWIEIGFAELSQFLTQAIEIQKNYLENLNGYNQSVIQYYYYINQ